jgi:hypothetical protein
MKTLALVLCVLSVGCDLGSESRDRAAVENQQTVYQRAQPVPAFDYSLERAVVIDLYKARNTRVATHSVWRSATGVIEGDCPSIAYPIPYDTSLTNPLQVAYSSSGAVTEMAEPNGLFASHNSTATWVRCVVGGAEVPIYVESVVTAYPYPLVVDYEHNRVTPAAGHRPTVTIHAGAHE